MSPTLETRLIRLERLNRLLLILLLGLAALFVLGSAARPETAAVVRSQRFELLDDQGGVRAALGADAEGSTGLFIYDDSGVARLTLTHDAEQSALFINDGTGTTRIGVAQFAHGGGGVALHGAGSKGAAVLYLKEAGSLTFYDDEGKVQTRVNGNE